MTPKNNKPVHLIESPSDIEPLPGDIDLISSRGEVPRRIAWTRLLWSRRRFLRKTMLFALLLTVVVSFLIPPRYQSATRLMPPDQQSGSGLAALAALAGRAGGGTGGSMSAALGGSLGGVAGDLLGLKTSGALFVDMLEGDTVQDDLITKFNLRKVYWDRYWQDARKDLAKHTDIKEDRKSGVITIQVTDRDPRRAQQMAQAYVEALNGLVSRVSTSSARRERMFLEQRLKTVKQNLGVAAEQFSQFASKNGTLDVPSQSKAMVESEATLQGQYVAAQSELEGLQQIYTDSNIRVRSLRARIGALKQQIEAMSGNKADLTSSGSDIVGEMPSIRKLPLVGVQWANLYREAKMQETIYELLTQEYELAKVQEAKEIPTVNVLDAPLLPERKSFPPRTVIVIVGTLFAFLLASAVVIGGEAWKQNQSAEKKLATEIWAQMASGNSKSKVRLQEIWSRFGGKNGSSGKAA